MLLSEIIRVVDELVPFPLQEEYDNSGLIIGDAEQEISCALICIDITDEVLQEAIQEKCDLIISHHPLIFTGLKRITGQNMTERLVAMAIRNSIAILALHTNLDNHPEGVNRMLSEKLGIVNPHILRPLEGYLHKLVTFCPLSYAESVRLALFNSGAGQIGNYDSCSFNVNGQGTFRALPGSHPFIGNQEELHEENEVRIEVIYPSYKEKSIISALKAVHPYEEVAFDSYPLVNRMPYAGAGMIGELPSEVDAVEFLQLVKQALNLPVVRHSPIHKPSIKKIAFCGGAGSFLIRDAMKLGADAYLTGDIKYHDFFLPDNRMILADIGHYESEQYTKELIFTLLNEKIPTFALLISETPTNPVNYL